MSTPIEEEQKTAATESEQEQLQAPSGGKEDAPDREHAYTPDYADSRFQTVETEKQDALAENEKLYDDMITNSDQYYQQQIDANEQWEQDQTAIQNEQTDFAIEQIGQQQKQEEEDYQKEQSGAYVDWQKQSNAYGVNAEQEAASGMKNSGYSESSKVSMYNAYQNRVATARASFRTAVQNYQNAIKEARLQNNAKLAEIAYQAFQKELELSMQMFQNKNQLLLDQANRKLEIESLYHQKWQDVLAQINQENALAEEIRQFNESMAEEQRQFNFANKIGEFAITGGYSGGGSSGGSGGYTPSRSNTGGKKTANLPSKGYSNGTSTTGKFSLHRIEK